MTENRRRRFLCAVKQTPCWPTLQHNSAQIRVAYRSTWWADNHTKTAAPSAVAPGCGGHGKPSERSDINPWFSTAEPGLKKATTLEEGQHEDKSGNNTQIRGDGVRMDTFPGALMPQCLNWIVRCWLENLVIIQYNSELLRFTRVFITSYFESTTFGRETLYFILHYIYFTAIIHFSSEDFTCNTYDQLIKYDALL